MIKVIAPRPLRAIHATVEAIPTADAVAELLVEPVAGIRDRAMNLLQEAQMASPAMDFILLAGFRAYVTLLAIQHDPGYPRAVTLRLPVDEAASRFDCAPLWYSPALHDFELQIASRGQRVVDELYSRASNRFLGGKTG